MASRKQNTLFHSVSYCGMLIHLVVCSFVRSFDCSNVDTVFAEASKSYIIPTHSSFFYSLLSTRLKSNFQLLYKYSHFGQVKALSPRRLLSLFVVSPLPLSLRYWSENRNLYTHIYIQSTILLLC